MTRHATNARLAGVTLLCTIAVAGCSDDDDSPSTISAEPDDTSMPTPDVTPGDTSMPAPGTTPGAPAPTTLDGEWLLACSPTDDEFPEDGYDVVTLTIAGDTATARILDYTDSGCTVPDTPAETVQSASIAYPGGTTETALGTAMHIDVTLEGITEDGVDQALPGTAIEYDIALVVGDELYFGDYEADPERDGESAERRPEVLETPPFVRQ